MNSELINFFQTTLDKGYFLDSKGNKINSSHALFIFSFNENEEKYANFKIKPSLEPNSFIDKSKLIEEKIGVKLISMIDEVIYFDKVNQAMFKNIVRRNIEKMNKNMILELSEIDDIEEKELQISGGDAAFKKAKEIIKAQKIKNI